MPGKSCLDSDDFQKEEEKLINFIAEKSNETKSPLNARQFSADFIETSGSMRSVDAVRMQLVKLRSKILEEDLFTTTTKMRICFALSWSIDEKFLDELRRDGVVELDNKKRIVKYRAHEGNLQLDGDHSLYSKIRMGRLRNSAILEVDSKHQIRKYNTNDGMSDLSGDDYQSPRIKRENINPRRWSGISNNSNHNEGGEEEREDGDLIGHDEEEQVEVITRSGRVSKKRHQYSWMEDNEDKNSVYDALKRRADSENQSQESRSIKQAKSMDRRRESPEDVIYEGPGEPPRPVMLPGRRDPFEKRVVILDENGQPKERKPEEIIFSYRSNDIKLEDVDDFSPDGALYNVSSELSTSSSIVASQSSTELMNVDKFLKLVRTLVGTLESPKLFRLREKIDIKIRKLGNKNLIIPVKIIPLSLESALHFVIRHATTTIHNTKDSASLKDFLLIFKAISFDLTSPEFADFQKSLKEASKDLEHQDKRVTFEKMQFGFELAIDFVLP